VGRRTAVALGLILAAIGLTAWSALAPSGGADAALVVGAAAAPIGVLLAVRARTGAFPRELHAAAGGGVVGPVVAIVSHTFVAAFAYAFFLGFAEAGRALLDALRVDPRAHDVIASPWFILLLVEVVVVAPLTEEAGKALGAFWFGRPRDRREAFLAGVAAGTGFAVVENLLYVGLAAAFGGPWQAVVLARTLGAAVHPLASGIVAVGAWDARTRGTGALLRGYLTGVGVHALWNGTIVVLAAASAVGQGPSGDVVGIAELVFSGVLGIALGGALWIRSGRVFDQRRPALGWSRPVVAGWVLLCASLVVPVAIGVLVFPSFIP
jgi:RsiW-degrading membrane proteinase PrsW (M82 family)